MIEEDVEAGAAGQSRERINGRQRVSVKECLGVVIGTVWTTRYFDEAG
jgi:hypothetical protein